WAHVARRATASRDDADVLDATGPYFLTGCHDSYLDRSELRLIPAATLYPVDKDDCWSGRVHDLEFRAQATRGAAMLHYWDGSWFRRGSDLAFGLPHSAGIRISDPSGPGEEAG